MPDLSDLICCGQRYPEPSCPDPVVVAPGYHQASWRGEAYCARHNQDGGGRDD